MTAGSRRRDYEHIAITRDAGVTELRIHRDGGPWIWPGIRPHLELVDAFREVTADPETRVVILTGTGDVFCYPDMDPTTGRVREFPDRWHDAVWWDGAHVLQTFLAIDVPVVSVINGPAWVHSEMPLLADIVVAADTASFSDHAHFPRDVVPGDGMHLVWLHLLGSTRGKRFLLCGETIQAEEALALGVVSEVVPAADALARGWELARDLARRPRPILRYTRAALNLGLRELMASALSHGLALEGLGVYAKAALEGSADQA